MKFTSEDLLKFFGLKVGDRVKVWHTKGSSFEWLIYDVVIDEFKNVMLNCELVHKVQISFLANRDFEIIQPKPTLTEDEKDYARIAYNQGYRYLAKDKTEKVCGISKEKPTRLYEAWGVDSDMFHFYLNMFPNLFQFIKWEDEPYEIKELLK